MTREEIKSHILEVLQPRMEMLGIREREIRPGLDLIKTGFVNSMEFVEMISGIEKKTGLEIDYEKALDDENFTTLGGIIDLFDNLQHD